MSLSLLWTSCILLLFLPTTQANTYFTDEAGSCQIIGDPDVYGTAGAQPHSELTKTSQVLVSD
jgi:hypothetical protein